MLFISIRRRVSFRNANPASALELQSVCGGQYASGNMSGDKESFVGV